jgi:hypothetical protein
MKPWITYFGAHVRTINQNGSIIVQRENPTSPGAWVDVKTYNASWANQCTEAHLHAQALAHGEPYPPPSITKADGGTLALGPSENLEPSPEDITQYREKLAAHDWFYDWSDDHRVWRQGQEARKELERLASRLDPDLIIWFEYAPQ